MPGRFSSWVFVLRTVRVIIPRVGQFPQQVSWVSERGSGKGSGRGRGKGGSGVDGVGLSVNGEFLGPPHETEARYAPRLRAPTSGFWCITFLQRTLSMSPECNAPKSPRLALPFHAASHRIRHPDIEGAGAHPPALKTRGGPAFFCRHAGLDPASRFWVRIRQMCDLSWLQQTYRSEFVSPSKL